MEMSAESCESKPKRNLGLISVGVFGGLATGLMIVTWPFVLPAFRKIVLPYVPATSVQIDNVLKAIHYRRPHVSMSAQSKSSTFQVIDLGSGDGRIVIECAKQGIRSHGVELNPWLVLYSKYRAFMEGVHKLASFQRKNLFKVDLSTYEKVVVFGVDSLMPLIENKIRNDCDTNNKKITLIACRFPLPNWQPAITIGSGVDQVWVYNYYPSNNVQNS